MLAKNPTGFNQILLESERLAGARHFLLGLNDRIADGRDVSWIWDVDFEVLAGRAELVVPSGDRAYDMALRLKYAGVSAATPPQPDLGKAIDQLIEAVPPGGSGHVLCTYTAMLELRALLVRRGWLRPYWAT
jgi:UDP-N-acetylmuramyl tripeptide synthase